MNFDKDIEIIKNGYEETLKKVQEYINNRKIRINRLNLSLERLTEEKDSLPLDYPSRDAVIEEYNKQISMVEDELKSLIEPSDKDLNEAIDIRTQYAKEIEQLKRDISDYISLGLERRQERLYLDKREWEYERKSQLDKTYIDIIEEYQRNKNTIRELQEIYKKYDELKEELDNNLDELYKNKYQKINDILNKRDEIKEEIQEENIIEKEDEQDKEINNEETKEENLEEELDEEKLLEEIDEENLEEENIEDNTKVKEETKTENNIREYVLNEEATMQNYRNSGYSQNVSEDYFNPTKDEYDKDYNPLNDSLFQVFDIYEIINELNEEATMQNYRNSGYSQNAMGWYFNIWIDEYDPNYNPLEDSTFQVFNTKKVKTGQINGIDLTEDEKKNIISIEDKKDEEKTEDNDTVEDKKDEEKTEDNEYSYEEAIEKLKEALIPELNEEQLDSIIAKINSLVVLLFQKEEKEFEDALKETKGVINKINLIQKREQRISNYSTLYSHENINIKEMLEKKGNIVLQELTNIYNNTKNNGEYCWKEFDNIRNAMQQIIYKIAEKEEEKNEFYKLIASMQDIIKNPDENKYNVWKEEMKNFADKNQIDSSHISIYFTAEAKELNDSLSVDKEYNIVGLNINKKKEKEETKKKRKVTKVSKIKNWMKEHKLTTIALGLALAGGTLMLIPQTHMMINSVLWLVGKKLGFSAASLNTLNGINQALAKSIKGGKYAYNAASGMYTLGGAAGAKALYTSGAAKLVGALEGLLVGGTIGTGLTAAIKAITNKIKNKKKEKEEIIQPEEKNEENLIKM